MAAGIEVAQAYVTIIPSMRDSQKIIAKEFDAETIGNDAGKKIGAGIGSGLDAKRIAVGNILGNLVTRAADKAASAVSSVIGGVFEGSQAYEQLSGGVEKIFDQADITKIMSDAQGAYADLNMSANQYIESINSVGATFAQTMGDQKGYDTAREGMKAISDYASGTGKSIDLLNDKYSLITRSTSSYQSIADQFSGILPATSDDFLKQAQAADILSGKYKKLTDVPVAEYQEAVTKMLSKGVEDMGLMGNTLSESMSTISGSMAMAKSAYANFLTAIGSGDAEMMATAASNLVTSLFGAINEETGKREGGLTANLVGLAQRSFQSLGGYLPGMVNGALSSLPDVIEKPLRGTINRITGMFGKVDVADSLAGAFKAAAPVVTNAMGGILTSINRAYDVITTEVLPVGKQVYDTIAPVIVNIYRDVQSHLPQIQETFGSAMGAIRDLVADVWPDIKDTVLTATSIVGSTIEAMWPIIKVVFEKIQAVTQAAWPYVTTIIKTSVALIKGAVNGLAALPGKVNATFSKVRQAIVTPINAARDAVQGAIDRIKSIINGAHLSLPHFALPHFRIDGGEVPWGIGGKGHAPSVHVDWYAQGGWIDTPTILAGVGERGGEFVWPSYAPYLDRYADALASRMDGGGITVNLTYNGMGDAEDLVRLLTRDLRMMRMTGAI